MLKVVLRAQTAEEDILFEVGSMRVSVGRHSSNIVRIKDAHCSSNHCTFWVEGNRLFIEDLKSKNGTFVNGVRIHRNQVFIQDRITLGDSLITVSNTHNTPDILKNLDFPGTLDDRTSIGISLQTSSQLDMIRLNPRSALEGDRKMFGKRITQKIIRPRGYEPELTLSIWHEGWRHWLTTFVDVICMIIAFSLPFIVLLWFDEALDEESSINDIITSPNLSIASVGSLLLGIFFRHVNMHAPGGTIGERISGLSDVPTEQRTHRKPENEKY